MILAPQIRWLVTVGMVTCAWAGLRLFFRAPFRPSLPMLLDLFAVLWCWLLVALLFDRPLLASIVTGFGAVGLAFADYVKRETLREPLVFSDRAELLELIRHPEFYLPFAGTGSIVAGLVALAISGSVLMWLEPPLGLSVVTRLLMFIAMAGLYGALAVPPLLRLLGGRFAAWKPACDPAVDSARFGLLACFVVHGTLARSGRRALQLRYRPQEVRAPLPLPFRRHVVLMQLESFCDLDRLIRDAPQSLSPNYGALRARAVQYGRLDVPCWGANTIRSEFTVLTGIKPASLGLDQYNPYERFARVPVRSIAWTLGQLGYHTLCVHPFDLRFYGRSTVLRRLGFDCLVGPEAFPQPRRGAFVCDAEIAAYIEHLLDGARDPCLVFAITVAGHGPWDGPCHPAEKRLPDRLAALPGGRALAAYMAAHARMDAILPLLQDIADRHDAVLAVYGDHQPSLPMAFAALGVEDAQTDYAIYDPRSDGVARACDLPAASLASAVLRHLQAAHLPAPSLVDA